jgi:hypothetical protein
LGTRHHVGKKDGGSYITAGKLYIINTTAKGKRTKGQTTIYKTYI